MLHGDMTSYAPLIEERRNNRDGTGNEAQSALLARGSMLFPDLVNNPVRWLQDGDDVQAAAFTHARMLEIGAAMVGPTDSPEAIGPIPAAYTYFGQFVFHDMVFSRVFGVPNAGGQMHHLRNAVSQGLDLSGLYGRGPEVDGHLYDSVREGGPACLFPLGLPCHKTDLPDGTVLREPSGSGVDLPRLDMTGSFVSVKGRSKPYRPLVADPRNDDNLILSQLLATLMNIHNRLVSVQPTGDNRRTALAYDNARRFLISFYRHIVVNDYLRRILDPGIWTHFFDRVEGVARQTEALQRPPGLPLEFTFGASRFAHGMVRQFYRVNAGFDDPPGTLDKVLSFSSLRPDGDVPVEATWLVDWKRFASDRDEQSVQRARRISPFFASALASSELAAETEGEPRSVAFMDNWRCYELGLPSGQTFAKALRQKLVGRVDVPELKDDDILPTPACVARFRYHADRLKRAFAAAPRFLTDTPLSYYVLQESSVLGDDGSRLGPVGSYIIGATVAASLYGTTDTNFLTQLKVPIVDEGTLAGLLALGDAEATPGAMLVEILQRSIR